MNWNHPTIHPSIADGQRDFHPSRAQNFPPKDKTSPQLGLFFHSPDERRAL
jgi:hypothetical protein